jgi:hypothetical protein
MVLISSTITEINAEIKTPNYDFTLSSLELFFPGRSLEVAKKSQAKFDVFEDSGDQKILRFKLLRAGYVLDVYTQVKQDQFTDMYVRLPQHFLHDLMLSDLQKRYKKQTHYVKKDSSALYVWKNIDGNNIVYQGSCSITCFPMFLEVVKASSEVIPLYQKFNDALPLWEIK